MNSSVVLFSDSNSREFKQNIEAALSQTGVGAQQALMLLEIARSLDLIAQRMDK